MAGVTTVYEEAVEFADYLADRGRELTALERLEALLVASDRVLDAAELLNLATGGRGHVWSPRERARRRDVQEMVGELARGLGRPVAPLENVTAAVDRVLDLQEHLFRLMRRERGEAIEDEEVGEDA